MRLTLTAVLTLAALSACDRQAAAPAQPQQEIQVRSAGQKNLFAASDLNRAIALKRAILDTGATCKRVAATGYVSRFKNMDYWTASCADQFNRLRDWAIFVGADDSVQVRLCGDTAKAGLPACTVKTGTEGGSGMATKKRAS